MKKMTMTKRTMKSLMKKMRNLKLQNIQKNQIRD